MNNREAIQAMLDGEKVKLSVWSTGDFLEMDDDGDYIDSVGTCITMGDYGSGEWEIYKEPKKKVKMWQWVIKHSASGRLCITDGFYTGKDSLPSPLEPVQKAEWTEIEMEIEE